MKNTKSSITIDDLAPLSADNIKELSSAEINRISGGMTSSSSLQISGTLSDIEEPYSYKLENGEVIETGTRPEGLSVNSSFSSIPIDFTPIEFSFGS